MGERSLEKVALYPSLQRKRGWDTQGQSMGGQCVCVRWLGVGGKLEKAAMPLISPMAMVSLQEALGL